jgi:hypothetical protein
MGNQNPYIEAEQITQWPKEKGQRDKQRSKKHTHKTKDLVKRVSLNSVINDKHKYYLLNDENTFVTEISEDQKQTCKGEMTT